ncbi:PREDICTED: galactan beta-1,4-galactosyltransferase GALS3-like [Ipomoea nil]|uniref:galactan beta-1,4-galactosyltransferase GALS3-like n=1 Tax=Ipomoea nil TaxID=35883 RepID=UPI000900B73F|nr:PREDICTED: galactan beta-1,4-galactosyltransferase GALS3-like [Ipomoea nil]
MTVKDQKGGGGDRKMFVGVVWNCAAELKLLLTALLFLFCIITVLQFIPSPLSLSTADLRNCLSKPAAVKTNLPVLNAASLPTPLQRDRALGNGAVKRGFTGIGSAAYTFILMSAYRGGYNTFAVMGLASKPLHVFGTPSYRCEWVPAGESEDSVFTPGQRILPDWGYGRVYTVVVVNCTFPVPVGDADHGGKLLIHAATNGGGDSIFNITDTFEALIESPGDFENFSSVFKSPPKYDYLYCGSPIYGDLSPQRIREWVAYHVRLFGEKSHFVIYDAGGAHPAVMEVLRPWMEKGYVTLQDVKEEERFDGYYHNQFLIVNDCLHRYKFQAKWMFFFDVDEFIFIPKKNTLKSVVDSLSPFTQFTIEQMPMSNKLCLREDAGKTHRKWGFEKLVFKDSKTGIRRDRKYAVQPRNVAATGVHMSENAAGNTTHKTEGRIMYYHYHGTIAQRREPCRQLVNDTRLAVDGISYVVDPTMRDVAGAVKRFELKTIGPVLQRTRQ